MKRCSLNLTVVMLLVCASGCPVNYSLCNGTSEPIVYKEEHSMFGESFTPVEPCSCDTFTYYQNPLRTGDRAEPLFSVYYLANPDDDTTLLNFDPDAGLHLTFDGFKLHQEEPDFSQKKTITFRNLSPDDVVFSIFGFPIHPPDKDVPASETYQIVVLSDDTVFFDVYDEDGAKLETLIAAIVDGLEIIWDGEDLTAGATPPPPPPPPAAEVEVDLCNEDVHQNAPAVIMIVAGEDVVPEKNVISGDCRKVTVPTASPVRFEVYDSEGVLLLDECTLNDPSVGDRVVWDGYGLTCVEGAAFATAALTPVPQPDPVSQLTFEALRQGNRLKKLAGRQIQEYIDELNPFKVRQPAK